MSNKLEIRRENVSFDLLIPEIHNEIFADGLAQILIGKIVSKVSLYSSDGPDEQGIEQRKVVARISMTNDALLNVADQIIGRLRKNKEHAANQNQSGAT